MAVLFVGWLGAGHGAAAGAGPHQLHDRQLGHRGHGSLQCSAHCGGESSTAQDREGWEERVYMINIEDSMGRT